MSEATETLGELYAAFAAGDAGRLGALLADTEWVEPREGLYGGTYCGFAAIAENVFGRLGADVEGFETSPDTIVAVGRDGALATGNYRGTIRGAPFDARFAHLAQVADGRIVRFEQFTDTHAWHLAMNG